MCTPQTSAFIKQQIEAAYTQTVARVIITYQCCVAAKQMSDKGCRWLEKGVIDLAISVFVVA